MAHPDLKADHGAADHSAHLEFIPLAAAQAFGAGDEKLALTLLARARDLHPGGSLAWAKLERLVGLMLIHTLREVEGTFCLERADARLEALGATPPQAALPQLEWLSERLGVLESDE